MSKKVAIILVNYNGKRDTEDCIKSLREIRYDNYEIIIVDNCSTDGSKEYITNKYKDVIYIYSDKNLGFSGANNYGIDYALSNNADYILLLNNDTEVDVDFLDIMINEYEKDSKIGIMTSTILYFSEKSKVWYGGGKHNYILGNSYHENQGKNIKTLDLHVREVSFISGCVMLISRNVIENVGKLSEEYFLYHEDTDYCLKVMKRGYKLIYVPQAKVYHKVSSSTNKISNLHDYYYTRNRFIVIEKNSRGLERNIAKIFCYIASFKRSITNKQGRNAIRKGVNDYRKGIYGKQQYESK